MITIVIEQGLNIEEYDNGGIKKWLFSSADWQKFKHIHDQEMQKIVINEEVDNLNVSVCKVILEAANKSMLKKEVNHKSKIVPWWIKECTTANKSGNKAFKTLKRNHSFQDLIEYKRLQANLNGKKLEKFGE